MPPTTCRATCIVVIILDVSLARTSPHSAKDFSERVTSAVERLLAYHSQCPDCDVIWAYRLFDSASPCVSLEACRLALQPPSLSAVHVFRDELLRRVRNPDVPTSHSRNAMYGAVARSLEDVLRDVDWNQFSEESSVDSFLEDRKAPSAAEAMLCSAGHDVSPCLYLFAETPDSVNALAAFEGAAAFLGSNIWRSSLSGPGIGASGSHSAKGIQDSKRNRSQFGGTWELRGVNHFRRAFEVLRKHGIGLVWVSGNSSRAESVPSENSDVHSAFSTWLSSSLRASTIVHLDSMLLDRRILPFNTLLQRLGHEDKLSRKFQSLDAVKGVRTDWYMTDVVFVHNAGQGCSESTDSSLVRYFRAELSLNERQGDTPPLSNQRGPSDNSSEPHSSLIALRGFIPNTVRDEDLFRIKAFDAGAQLLRPLNQLEGHPRAPEGHSWTSLFAGLMLSLAGTHRSAIANVCSVDSGRLSVLHTLIIQPITPILASVRKVSLGTNLPQLLCAPAQQVALPLANESDSFQNISPEDALILSSPDRFDDYLPRLWTTTTPKWRTSALPATAKVHDQELACAALAKQLPLVFENFSGTHTTLKQQASRWKDLSSHPPVHLHRPLDMPATNNNMCMNNDEALTSPSSPALHTSNPQAIEPIHSTAVRSNSLLTRRRICAVSTKESEVFSLRPKALNYICPTATEDHFDPGRSHKCLPTAELPVANAGKKATAAQGLQDEVVNNQKLVNPYPTQDHDDGRMLCPRPAAMEKGREVRMPEEPFASTYLDRPFPAEVLMFPREDQEPEASEEVLDYALLLKVAVDRFSTSVAKFKIETAEHTEAHAQRCLRELSSIARIIAEHLEPQNCETRIVKQYIRSEAEVSASLQAVEKVCLAQHRTANRCTPPNVWSTILSAFEQVVWQVAESAIGSTHGTRSDPQSKKWRRCTKHAKTLLSCAQVTGEFIAGSSEAQSTFRRCFSGLFSEVLMEFVKTKNAPLYDDIVNHLCSEYEQDFSLTLSSLRGQGASGQVRPSGSARPLQPQNKDTAARRAGALHGRSGLDCKSVHSHHKRKEQTSLKSQEPLAKRRKRRARNDPKVLVAEARNNKHYDGGLIRSQFSRHAVDLRKAKDVQKPLAITMRRQQVRKRATRVPDMMNARMRDKLVMIRGQSKSERNPVTGIDDATVHDEDVVVNETSLKTSNSRQDVVVPATPARKGKVHTESVIPPTPDIAKALNIPFMTRRGAREVEAIRVHGIPESPHKPPVSSRHTSASIGSDAPQSPAVVRELDKPRIANIVAQEAGHALPFEALRPSQSVSDIASEQRTPEGKGRVAREHKQLPTDEAPHSALEQPALIESVFNTPRPLTRSEERKKDNIRAKQTPESASKMQTKRRRRNSPADPAFPISTNVAKDLTTPGIAGRVSPQKESIPTYVTTSGALQSEERSVPSPIMLCAPCPVTRGAAREQGNNFFKCSPKLSSEVRNATRTGKALTEPAVPGSSESSEKQSTPRPSTRAAREKDLVLNSGALRTPREVGLEQVVARAPGSHSCPPEQNKPPTGQAQAPTSALATESCPVHTAKSVKPATMIREPRTSPRLRKSTSGAEPPMRRSALPRRAKASSDCSIPKTSGIAKPARKTRRA